MVGMAEMKWEAKGTRADCVRGSTNRELPSIGTDSRVPLPTSCMSAHRMPRKMSAFSFPVAASTGQFGAARAARSLSPLAVRFAEDWGCQKDQRVHVGRLKFLRQLARELIPSRQACVQDRCITARGIPQHIPRDLFFAQIVRVSLRPSGAMLTGWIDLPLRQSIATHRTSLCMWERSNHTVRVHSALSMEDGEERGGNERWPGTRLRPGVL